MRTEIEAVVENIRKGVIDINNQELFFSTLIKGVLKKLEEDIKIRNISVPHMIIHTGSDAFYLERKGQDMTKEPYSVSNEDYIYSVIPRCIANPGSIDILTDQLTNPYSFGHFQYDSGDQLYEMVAEFRRMPIKMGLELKYNTDSYRDMLELIQQIISKLMFIRTYEITYMGQTIKCSYRLPENFSDEHLMDIDGKTQDNKSHNLTISIEIETNLPIFESRTVMSANNFIKHTTSNIKELKRETD